MESNQLSLRRRIYNPPRLSNFAVQPKIFLFTTILYEYYQNLVHPYRNFLYHLYPFGTPNHNFLLVK